MWIGILLVLLPACRSGQKPLFEKLVVVAQSGYTVPEKSYTYRLELGPTIAYAHTEGGVRCQADSAAISLDQLRSSLRICPGAPAGGIQSTIHDRPQRYLELLQNKARRKVLFVTDGSPNEYLCAGQPALESAVRQALLVIGDKCSTNGARVAFGI